MAKKRRRLRRRDLAWAVEVDCELDRETARRAANAVLKAIAGGLHAGFEIELRGFGRFRPDPDAPFVPAESLRRSLRRARAAGFPVKIRRPRLPRTTGPKAKVIKFPKPYGVEEIEIRGLAEMEVDD